jgi:Domain of unknown function (DUF4234)
VTVAEALTVGTTTVKIRSPILVFIWALVTLGIYYVVWYYKVNRELRDACGIDVSPGVSTLAIFPGGLVIIPPFISWYRTFERIADAQERAGLEQRANPVLGFVLYVIAFFLLPIELVYAQDELNKIWRARPG